MSRFFRIFRVSGLFLTASLLVACGTGDGDTGDPDVLVVALEAEAGVELGVAQASYGTGLTFRHFVNDTDDVLAEVRATGDGELSLVFVAEAPASGRLGRLVFEQRSSGDASLTVSPLRVAGGSGEIGLATQQEVLDEAPAARANPDGLASRSAAAGGLQHVPEMVDHPLGDVDADGGVTLEDADALRAILFADDGAADDFELYHGDLVYDGTIRFADVAQLALKATGDAEPMIHAAPRILRIGSGESAYVLVGNAGAGDLPDLEVAGVRGGNPQPVPRASAVGRVYELTSNGTTMGAVFDAGPAGRAGVLNDLMELEAHGDQAETALAEAAAAFSDFETLVAHVEDEGFTGPAEETAAILRDDGAMLADVYQAAFDGAEGSATVTYIEAHGGQVAYALIFGADGNPTAEARLEGGELVVDELTMATLATGPCLINLSPQQGGGSEAECKRRCRERFCDIDFGSMGLDDLETPCKVLAYLHCGPGFGGNDCKPPPPPPPGCRSCGDPHLYTFDGLAFDFQAAGEFWLVHSDAGDLTVQSRQEPVRDSTTVAINTAVAVGVLGDRVVLDAAGATPLRINGVPTNLSEGALGLPNGGALYAEGNEYRISWPDGSVVSAWLRGSRLDIGVELAEGRAGSVSGLLGDFDGDPADDVRPRDGEALSDPDFASFYDDFGESWRIAQAESLFDYAAGEDTSTYTLPGIPTRFVSAATLSAQDRQAARSTCEARGVTDPVALENCILDVASTGDASFADSALAAPAADASLEVCGEPVLVNADINTSTTWGCPAYIVDRSANLTSGAVLTIAPGTEVVFREDAGLFAFGDDTAIHAAGTAADPIRFRGERNAAGSWRGLAFRSDSPLNELTHVIVSDGGSFAHLGQEENRSNVFVAQGRLKLSHATIANSAGHGLKATPGSNLTGFAGNRFESNAGAPMAIATPIIGDLDDASTYAPAGAANGEPYILVERDIDWVTTDQIWPSNDVPYRFLDQDLIQSGRVTIAPGAVFEFAADAALTVGDLGGALIANAEGADAIVFRGVEAGSGWWRGLTVQSNDPGNVLNNVVVSGGGNAPSGPAANIVVSGALELRNSIIRDSAGYGVYLQNQGATEPEDPTDPEAGNTFEGIAEEAVGP